jgi:hypothetical protein
LLVAAMRTDPTPYNVYLLHLSHHDRLSARQICGCRIASYRLCAGLDRDTLAALQPILELLFQCLSDAY